MAERTDKNVGWRFNQEFIDRLKAIAERKGLGTNTLARVVLIEWMEEEEERYAATRKNRVNTRGKS